MNQVRVVVTGHPLQHAYDVIESLEILGMYVSEDRPVTITTEWTCPTDVEPMDVTIFTEQICRLQRVFRCKVLVEFRTRS